MRLIALRNDRPAGGSLHLRGCRIVDNIVPTQNPGCEGSFLAPPGGGNPHCGVEPRHEQQGFETGGFIL